MNTPHDTAKDTARIPQPRVRPIVGNGPDLDPDAPIQSMVKLAEELGPIYRLTFPSGSLLVLGSLEFANELADETRFEKKVSGALTQLRDFVGDGLFTAHTREPNWGKAHRLLMPAFGPQAMRNYFDDMLDIADQMLTKWERLGQEAALDVSDNMTRLTLDTIALCGFNYRFNSFYQNEPHPVVEAMVRALAEAGNRSRRLPIQNQLMVRTQRQYDADGAFMHSVSNDLIAKRRKVPADDAPRDLLNLMMTGKDGITGEQLDDTNISNQMLTFLVAGHETTSGLLTFATHMMLKHPDILHKAQEEVDRVLGDETPRLEHISKLTYIDQILRETLRLWPTAPAFVMTPKHDTLLAGRYPVKARDVLLLLLPALHRDPAVWQDPHRFDPERWAPDKREKIPPHAWKPFGTGERACIGRAFAMQEAVLVVGMLLQRFEIWEPQPYDLVVKEALTIKPDGLRIHARVRKPVSRAFSTKPALRPADTTPKSESAVPSHGTPLLLLYGSNSGASEAFARRVASDGQIRGYAAKVAPLDDYAGKLPKDGAIILVTASYNGQAPDNARKFHTWLAGTPDASLVGVRYALFGCGNKDWMTTYQAIPKDMAAHLERAGAQALVPRGEGDARGDFFGDFESWYAPLWETLGKSFGIGTQTVASGPLYDVEVVPSASVGLAKENALEFSTVLTNRELVDMSSPFGRSKKHIEFELPKGVTYAAGDYLAVLPVNHPELVARAAKRLGLRPDQAVILRSTRGAMAASLPTDRPVMVEELLGNHVELSAPATRKDIERLAAKNPCPPHAMELQALASDVERYQKDILAKRISVLDLLEQYESCQIAIGEFLELLPAMRVRQYSISSSPRVNPSRCTVTVAVVNAPHVSGRGQFYGTCSSFLGRLHTNEQVPVAIRTPNVPFHPPALNSTPAVMICAGTGLAPFRGFVQERAHRHVNGEPAGKALLFYGLDHPEVDFLYKDEFTEWERDGIVAVYPAYFRRPEGEIMFVQHRLWQEREKVRELYRKGAIFYLCGDGKLMAPAVRRVLEQIYQETVNCTDAEAASWLLEMEHKGRYVPDVFA
jgi:cytochrome P450 / NADPH-cytochrome P450 reductase